MLFSNRIGRRNRNQPDTCLADTYNLTATCPTETSDLPNRTLPPAKKNPATCPTINQPPAQQKPATCQQNH